MVEPEKLKEYLQECIENKKKTEVPLTAKRILELPGLHQTFRLYREQSGRHLHVRYFNGRPTTYRPIYEAVYESEETWKGSEIGFRAITKLIFSSRAEEFQIPLGVEEMLLAIPEDKLAYLLDVLNEEGAVVSFHNKGDQTGFIINFDKSELWEQEQSILDALYPENGDEVMQSAYMMIRNGKASIIPDYQL